MDNHHSGQREPEERDKRQSVGWRVLIEFDVIQDPFGIQVLFCLKMVCGVQVELEIVPLGTDP